MSSSVGNGEGRYDSMRHIYGEDGFHKIRTAKLLIVGAGGIGCEVSSVYLF